MTIKFACPLFVLLTVALVTGCKKESDPVAPDLAATAAGTYTINSVSQGTTSVPVSASLNYTATLTRVSDNVVDLTFKTTTTGGVPAITLSGTPAAITFQKSYTTSTPSTGNANGDITNGILTFNSVEGGVSYKVVAKK